MDILHQVTIRPAELASLFGRSADHPGNFDVTGGVFWHGALHLLVSSFPAAADPERAALAGILRLARNESPRLAFWLEGREGLASLAPLHDGWVVLPHGTTGEAPPEVKFLPWANGAFGPSRPLRLTNGLPLHSTPTVGPFTRDLAQETGQFLLTDCDIIALPFHTSDHIKTVAFLQVDASRTTAEWQAWPTSAEPPKSGLLSRLLGGAAKTAKPQKLEFPDFIRLPVEDYPHDPGFAERPVWVQEVALAGMRPRIFSRGPNESTKHGAFGATLAEIGPTGAISRRILVYDHLREPDAAKKRAFHGRFVAGGSAFVMRAEYASTDLWDGAEGLVDMATGAITVLAPPKGCKGMQLVDVIDSEGWFFRQEADGTLHLWSMTLPAKTT